MKNKRRLVAFGAIPLIYVLASVLIEAVMFGLMKLSFPSEYYISFAIVLIFACIVACIPSRIAQIAIFFTVLSVKVFVCCVNAVSFFNLGEIFTFENLRAIKEILQAKEVGNMSILAKSIPITLLIFGVALVSAIHFLIEYKNEQRYSFLRPKNFLIMLMVVIVLFSTQLINYSALGAYSTDPLENMYNKKYCFDTFANRSFNFATFGSPAFYMNNLLYILDLKKKEDLGEVGVTWDGADYYSDYDYMLDENYNLIMLMMESIEFSAITPELTPNLWKVRNMSTWVDGYYSMDRTCFTEYLSLTGSHVLDSEMWRDYGGAEVTHSLPNIFKREGYDQIDAFHNFSKGFYDRNKLFTPNKMGFNGYFGFEDYGVPIKADFNCNSDFLMFETMMADIAPGDKSFFSYALNVSTHGNYWGSNQTWPLLNGDGTQILGYESVFPESLAAVLTNYDVLAEKYYPQLRSTASVRDRAAKVAYLTSVCDYDRGVGYMLDYLETTPDTKHFPDGDEHGNPVHLIDTTALVFYTDHLGYGAFDKLNFMIYNPTDMQARSGGKLLQRFASPFDIYKTVCHLFNIETANLLTLGVSVLNPDSQSVGYWMASNKFYGYDADTGAQFRTQDFETFEISKPSDELIEKFRERASAIAATFMNLKYVYSLNLIKAQSYSRYTFGGHP